MSGWNRLLADLPLLADGPAGDWLRARRFAAGRAPEALNLELPEAVTAAHRAYRQAGATLHRTNTARATRWHLAAHGLAQRCEAINNSGSAALRQAIGTSAVMAGRIGPIDDPAAPAAERERAYSEQAIYLSDTGVDLFILEHFATVEEAARALRVIRGASDAPALALLRFDARGAGGERRSAGEAGRALLQAGAEALGVSCAPGGAALAGIVEALLPLGAPLGVMLSLPAALGRPYGTASRRSPSRAEARPEREGPGEEAGAGDAERFAEALAALGQRGVAIVGGCCGVMPAHIRAAAARLGKGAPGKGGAKD
jgi:methionine synthase I (cobalamin-dependent)